MSSRPRRPTRASGRDQDGTEQWIGAVVNEHGAALTAFATRLTSDRYAAQDVVQETLVRAWQRRDELERGGGSLRAWLLTVARNIVIDRARARAARPTEVAETAGLAVPHDDDHAGRVVDTITMANALDTLSPEHRQVLVELYYRGRSVADTAAVLGIAAGTVKSRAYYAVRALRPLFDTQP